MNNYYLTVCLRFILYWHITYGFIFLDSFICSVFTVVNLWLYVCKDECLRVKAALFHSYAILSNILKSSNNVVKMMFLSDICLAYSFRTKAWTVPLCCFRMCS